MIIMILLDDSATSYIECTVEVEKKTLLVSMMERNGMKTMSALPICVCCVCFQIILKKKH